jgi:hypothetical protein
MNSSTLARRGPGRPPKPEGEAKRAFYQARIREALKAELETSASAAGRSLSEEIEFRLERSLEREETMREAGQRLLHARLGGPENAAYFLTLASMPQSDGVGDTWLYDRAKYDRMAERYVDFIQRSAPPTNEEALNYCNWVQQEIARLLDPNQPIESRRKRAGLVACSVGLAPQRGATDEQYEELRESYRKAMAELSEGAEPGEIDTPPGFV